MQALPGSMSFYQMAVFASKNVFAENLTGDEAFGTDQFMKFFKNILLVQIGFNSRFLPLP